MVIQTPAGFLPHDLIAILYTVNTDLINSDWLLFILQYIFVASPYPSPPLVEVIEPPVISGSPSIAVSPNTAVTLTCTWPLRSQTASLQWVDPVTGQVIQSQRFSRDGQLISVYKAIAQSSSSIYECQVFGVNGTDGQPLRDRVGIPIKPADRGNPLPPCTYLPLFQCDPDDSIALTSATHSPVSTCQSVPVSQCLSVSACQSVPVSQCLSVSTCLPVPVSVCQSVLVSQYLSASTCQYF